MKHWRTHRLVAVLLLVCTLVGMLPFTAVYADSTSDITGGSALDDDKTLYGGKTLEEISLILNYSKRHIERLHIKALEKFNM